MKTSTLFQVLSFSGNFVDEKFHMESVNEAAKLGLEGSLEAFKNKINDVKKVVDFGAAQELMNQGYALVTGEELVVKDGPVFKSDCQFFGQSQIQKMLSNGAVLVR